MIRLDQFDDPIELKISQVTPRAVSTLFSIDIETVWLKEQGDDGQRAFFPNVDKTSFDLSLADEVKDILYVMGSPPRADSGYPYSDVPCASSSTPVLSASSTACHGPVRPVFSRKSVSSTTSGLSSINAKVVQVSISKNAMGKIEFHKKAQMYIPVKEFNATVPYITQVAQQNWGPAFILITADGLRLEDSPGTQGLSFWRVGSRKIFAVREDQLVGVMGKGKGKGKGKQKKEIVDILSSDEDEPPSKKKTKLSVVVDEVKSLKKVVDDAMKVTKGMPLPPGLYKCLDQTFQCRICHLSPLKSPPIFTRCCRNIIGCGSCVDNWFKAESTCPLCRADRALPGTCIVNGLDQLIESLGPLLNQSGDIDESCSSGIIPSPPRRTQLPANYLNSDSD